MLETIAGLYSTVKPSYMLSDIASLDMWNIEEEARRLAERFKNVENRAKFARDFGVPGGGSMVYQHIQGIKPISLDAAIAYAKGFDCALSDISPRLATELEAAMKRLSPLSNSQPGIRETESPYSNVEDAPELGQARRVPVVGTAQLGDNGYWAELETPVGFGDGFVEVAVKDNNAYALRCRGDSMKPRIKDGEFVIVEPNQPPAPGDEVLVKAKDGRVMVKELLYVRDATVHLLSVNETHGKLTIPVSEVECMHLVSGIVKRSLWRQD